MSERVRCDEGSVLQTGVRALKGNHPNFRFSSKNCIPLSRYETCRWYLLGISEFRCPRKRELALFLHNY